MEKIDVHGLPEPVAQAIATLVETLRQHLRTAQLDEAAPARPPPRKLVPRPGNVIGDLSRKSIYGEYLDRKFPPAPGKT